MLDYRIQDKVILKEDVLDISGKSVPKGLEGSVVGYSRDNNTDYLVGFGFTTVLVKPFQIYHKGICLKCNHSEHGLNKCSDMVYVDDETKPSKLDLVKCICDGGN